MVVEMAGSVEPSPFPCASRPLSRKTGTGVRLAHGSFSKVA